MQRYRLRKLDWPQRRPALLLLRRLRVVAVLVVVETVAEATTVTVVLLVRLMVKMREQLLRLFPERQRVVVEIEAVAGTVVETVAGIEAAEQAQQHRPQQPMQPRMTAETMLQVRLPELQATVAADSLR